MADVEVATLDGVFMGAFGALGDTIWFGSGSFSRCHGGLRWLKMNEKDDEFEIKNGRQFIFDEVCAADELRTKKIIKFRLCGRALSWTLLVFAKRLGLYNLEEIEEKGFDVYFQGGLHSDEHFNAQEQFITKIAKRKNFLSKEVLNSLSALIYCRALDTTKLRKLIDSEGRLIPEASEPGVPRVAIPKPPRESMQDLYVGVFEHMAGVYSVPLQGAYNPPGYDQQQYDQYYQ
ncbi:hypothetical protein Tco_0983716 [Tanacetum coccineum]